MSTDLSTCKHICQNVSMLVREAGGRLIERSGPQFKVTYYQTYIFNIFFEYFHIFIYIYIYIYFHSFSYMFQHFPIFFLWSPMKPLLKMCVYIYIYICIHVPTLQQAHALLLSPLSLTAAAAVSVKTEPPTRKADVHTARHLSTSFNGLLRWSP